MLKMKGREWPCDLVTAYKCWFQLFHSEDRAQVLYLVLTQEQLLKPRELRQQVNILDHILPQVQVLYIWFILDLAQQLNIGELFRGYLQGVRLQSIGLLYCVFHCPPQLAILDILIRLYDICNKSRFSVFVDHHN